MYRLRFIALCGMRTIDEEHVEEQDARDRAARILRRRHKAGHPVSILVKGQEWEVGEPEDASMIPDTAGWLTLTYLPDDPD